MKMVSVGIYAEDIRTLADEPGITSPPPETLPLSQAKKIETKAAKAATPSFKESLNIIHLS